MRFFTCLIVSVYASAPHEGSSWMLRGAKALVINALLAQGAVVGSPGRVSDNWVAPDSLFLIDLVGSLEWVSTCLSRNRLPEAIRELETMRLPEEENSGTARELIEAFQNRNAKSEFELKVGDCLGKLGSADWTNCLAALRPEHSNH